jgi:exopolysaccharide production protein ExoY
LIERRWYPAGAARTADGRVSGLPRIFDVAIALMALLFLTPLLLLIAIAVLICDPGPIIFRHRRIGHNGKAFGCLKFRSMYVGAEERLRTILERDPELREQWERDQKLENDPRITKIGAMLRVTSLDELPQLINVVRGEMSLVGPRPIVAAEVPRYGRFIESYYQVRPGLTGLWQVTGRSATTYRRRVATDVYYARSRSALFDAKILFATIPAVVAGRGSM